MAKGCAESGEFLLSFPFKLLPRWLNHKHMLGWLETQTAELAQDTNCRVGSKHKLPSWLKTQTAELAQNTNFRVG
jgi:hypothetical protein